MKSTISEWTPLHNDGVWIQLAPVDLQLLIPPAKYWQGADLTVILKAYYATSTTYQPSFRTRLCTTSTHFSETFKVEMIEFRST